MDTLPNSTRKSHVRLRKESTFSYYIRYVTDRWVSAALGQLQNSYKKCSISVKKRMRGFLELCAAGVFVILVFQIVQEWWPTQTVVSDMRSIAQVKEDGKIKLHIVGKKNQNCSLIANSWAGYAQNNSTVWHQVPFEFINDYSYSENGSRPSGENDFSWWAWTTTKASSVLLTIRHECKGKIVQTSIGPFAVK
tara:strand:+ start:4189 stop:4767 length:579 start_codon:yes stop_codon:yes gene_type:complete